MIDKDINLNITSTYPLLLNFITPIHYLEEKMYYSNILFKGIVILIFLLVVESWTI